MTEGKPATSKAGPFFLSPVSLFALFFSIAALLFAAGSQPPGVSQTIRAAIRSPSSYVNDRVLAANVAETETAPTFSGASGVPLTVFISATCSNYYISVTGTAAVPVADVTDGGAAERAPTAYRIAQSGTLSVVADAACTVTFGYQLERGGD